MRTNDKKVATTETMGTNNMDGNVMKAMIVSDEKNNKVIVNVVNNVDMIVDKNKLENEDMNLNQNDV